MIRTPTLQRTWSAFASCDPAVARPPERPASDASADDIAAYKTALEDYAAKIKAAKEAGEWKPVLAGSDLPTRFQMGQVDRNVWRSIQDRCILPGDSPRYIGMVALNALLFRLSVREIAEYPKFERLPDPNWDHWVMAPASLITQLDEIDPSIVGEIGTEVFNRLRGVSPL